MATKEQILSEINTLCDQRKWNLTNEFKNKFVEKILHAFADGEIDVAEKFKEYEFTLETAYHSSNFALAAREKEYADKLKLTPKPQPKADEQIVKENPADDKYAELQKKLDAILAKQEQDEQQVTISQKRTEIYNKGIVGMADNRQNAFKKFLETQTVTLDADVETQANSFVQSYTAILKEEIGDVANYAGKGGSKSLEDEFADIVKEKIN